MFKKIGVILIGVMIGSLALSGLAFADESTPPEPGTRWGFGVVTAIGADNFTVKIPARGEHVIYVDGSTQFTDRDLKPLTFGDLKVDDRVIGASTLRSDGKWYAVLVHILPPPTQYRGVGVVNSVDEDENAFTFTNRWGRTWEFYVDSSTKFSTPDGRSLTFDDLQPGSRAFVAAERRSDDKWWATEVKILPAQPLPRP